MTNIDRADRFIRMALALLVYLIAALTALFISLRLGVNTWVGFGLFSIGYWTGLVQGVILR